MSFDEAVDRAGEMLRQAENDPNPQIGAHYLEVAASWMALAQMIAEKENI